MISVTADDSMAIRKVMSVLLQRIDPDGSHYTAESAQQAFEIIGEKHPQVVFLDIEMPGIDGIEAARQLMKRYPTLNIIFITGHSEYALEAHELFCSGFLCKPINESDIRRALSHLRFPLTNSRKLSIKCGNTFGVFYDGAPVRFKREKTLEMFAYLVYKQGVICSNGELIAALWDGDIEKQGFLRQLVLDMKTTFAAVGMSEIIEKQRGCIRVDPDCLDIEGDVESLCDYFGWV